MYMAVQSSTAVGSGTLPFTTRILTPAQRGQESEGRGERVGTNVIVVNPEDQIAVDAFAASGVAVGTSPVEVISPGTNPLPRSRGIILENTGGTAVLLGHYEGFQDAEAFELATTLPGSRIELPFLHNVTIYARTASSTSTVKFIVY
jgi:hypothetical protein